MTSFTTDLRENNKLLWRYLFLEREEPRAEEIRLYKDARKEPKKKKLELQINNNISSNLSKTFLSHEEVYKILSASTLMLCY